MFLGVVLSLSMRLTQALSRKGLSVSVISAAPSEAVAGEWVQCSGIISGIRTS